jgi:hypothetical protein
VLAARGALDDLGRVQLELAYASAVCCHLRAQRVVPSGSLSNAFVRRGSSRSRLLRDATASRASTGALLRSQVARVRKPSDRRSGAPGPSWVRAEVRAQAEEVVFKLGELHAARLTRGERPVTVAR